jgi:2-polyprenyl-3-methyl-5-hydroxy-6-metoxy-1,4-benzoquinol methylase
MPFNMSSEDIDNWRIRAILGHIPSDVSVLDIGGARELYNGESLHRKLAERAEMCVGIDINEKISEFPEYDIRHANAEKFDLNRKFNIAVAGELIEHLDNPGLMLDQVYNHLYDDGKLILTTPYPWTFLRIKQAILGEPFVVPDHVSWYCTETIENLLNRHGFEVVQTTFNKPRNLGVSWLFYKFGNYFGLRNLGSIGFLTVAKKTGQV